MKETHIYRHSSRIYLILLQAQKLKPKALHIWNCGMQRDED